MTKNIFEINTVTFINHLSNVYGKRMSLISVPDVEWEIIRDLGFEYIWLMGVWQRSLMSKQCAVENEDLRKNYDLALPGWNVEDISGSPYAIKAYKLDSTFGKRRDMEFLRTKLNRLGLKLILDFTANHLAVDHDWVSAYPNRFVSVTRERSEGDEDTFFTEDLSQYIAHGKDPYFSAWTDTAQLNILSSDLREALIKELLKIAKVADGVRCDMAMLSLNKIFLKTWQGFINDEKCPDQEFWKEAIDAVKSQYPDFIFIAECYWGLEWPLQQLGFDYTYDKDLYERMRSTSPSEIRDHLKADMVYQNRLVRFIENHDEERCVVAFGVDRSKAAAVVAATIPGLCLFYGGQLTGSSVKVPVQLTRTDIEKEDWEIKRFYSRLLSFIDEPIIKNGSWELLESHRAWDGNDSYKNILCWQWKLSNQRRLVIVNYSSVTVQARIRITLNEFAEKKVAFIEHKKAEEYLYDTEEVINDGLYVELEPWKYHLFEIN